MRSAGAARHAGGGPAAGFTLVEVMVAIVILATGALALTHLSLSVAVLMQQSSAKTELIALAENEMESVQSLDYDDLDAGVDEDTVSVRGKEYILRTTITAASARTREIEVELVSAEASLRYSALTYVSAP